MARRSAAAPASPRSATSSSPTSGAIFGFTEVKLGIIPAVISPFALAKIGRSAARELFLTGARFSAARAKEIGLVHAVAPAEELDAAVERYVREILSAGPEAVAAAKDLIPQVGAAGPRRDADDGRRDCRPAVSRRRTGRIAGVPRETKGLMEPR